MLANKEQIFQKNRFFEFLASYLKTSHLTPENLAKLDASAIIDTFLGSLGQDFRDYTRKYVAECKRRGVLEAVLPGALVRALTKPVSA